MWIDDVEKRIDDLIENMSDIEAKRLQLDYLLVVASRLDKEAESCERCVFLKHDFEKALEIIESAAVIKSSHRRAYNTRLKSIVTHFRVIHGLKSKTYYQNMYSHLGLLGGIAAGIWFYDHIVLMISIILIGPVIGKIIGYFKDQRKTDKLI